MASPFERIIQEALQSIDGLILPVTIEVDGEKRTIGVAALSYVDGSVHVAGEITDPRVAEVMMATDVAYFSAPDIPPIELPNKISALQPKWKEGLSDASS